MTTQNISPTVPLPTSVSEAINLNSSDKIFEPLEGTPFFIEGSDKSGYVAIVRNAILTKQFPTKEELISYVQSKPWELIITLQTFVCDTYHEIKNDESEETKTPLTQENS